MALIIPVAVLGLMASLSPSTIVVFILLLTTTRARLNAAAFLIGWLISLVVVFAGSYALGGARASHHGSGQTALYIAEILFGLGLLAVAGRQWRRRSIPHTGSQRTRRIADHLKQINPWEAAIVGVLEQPWGLTAAVAVVLIRHHSAALIAIIAFLVFTVLSTASVGLMYLYFARRPGEAETHLLALRDRVVRAGAAIVAIVSLLAGVYLTVDGIVGIIGG